MADKVVNPATFLAPSPGSPWVSEEMLQGNVFITGSGFLARGIMQRAECESWPCRFTVYSRNEHAQDACRHKYPRATYVLGDVRDTLRLGLAVAGHDVLIATAALKYVDIAENNISECIAINIGGIQSVIEAAWRNQSVHTVVGISTDKAVEPINTYGLSKAVGEKLFWEASRQIGDTKFVQTRYGNVVGSTGSVVPLFKRMEADYGEIRLTDPTMTRFWISIDHAIDMILAAVGSESGSIVIPSPKAMTLRDLAEAVCPGVKQHVVGLRPGEKIHEKLLTVAESIRVRRINFGKNTLYDYHPARTNTNLEAFELTSDSADKISVDEFRLLALAASVI